MVRAVIRVILIRHGATDWNETGRYQGHTDVALSDLGRRQAECLGRRLEHEPITHAYSSDLSRARETAEIALGRHSIPLEVHSTLREACFGAWEGLRYDEVGARYPREWAAWVQNPAHARPPGGGESLADLRERIVSAYREIVGPPTTQPNATAERRDWFGYRAGGAPAGHDGPTVLVVTHGGPVRALLTHVFDMPVDLYWRFGARPSSVTVLEVYPEGAVAEVIGDTSHL